MVDDDDEPKEWEIEDEIPAKSLENKWFKESLSFKETVICPSCQKELSRETLNCPFCNAQVFYRSGFLGTFLAWMKKIFPRK